MRIQPHRRTARSESFWPSVINRDQRGDRSGLLRCRRGVSPGVGARDSVVCWARRHRRADPSGPCCAVRGPRRPHLMVGVIRRRPGAVDAVHAPRR